jgi:hypothetical protein
MGTTNRSLIKNTKTLTAKNVPVTFILSLFLFTSEVIHRASSKAICVKDTKTVSLKAPSTNLKGWDLYYKNNRVMNNYLRK